MAEAGAYECTMVIPARQTQRLDALVEKAAALRRHAGVRGTIGMRDVLAQVMETGLDTLEASFTQAESQTRSVLLPQEWAARLSTTGRRGR